MAVHPYRYCEMLLLGGVWASRLIRQKRTAAKLWHTGPISVQDAAWAYRERPRQR